MINNNNNYHFFIYNNARLHLFDILKVFTIALCTSGASIFVQERVAMV